MIRDELGRNLLGDMWWFGIVPSCRSRSEEERLEEKQEIVGMPNGMAWHDLLNDWPLLFGVDGGRED